MNDDDIWDTAKKPVTDFVDAIKELRTNVDRLIQFYLLNACSKAPRNLNESSQQNKRKSIESETSKYSQDSGQDSLSPLACAKLELAIVFAINTCYWLYLVTNGQDPNKDTISKDLERVRLFMLRAKEVDQAVRGQEPCTKKAKIETAGEEW